MRQERYGIPVVCAILLLTSLAGPTGLNAEEFSQERAYEHLRHLAGTIGPRPLGSPGEKAALEYFALKIAEFGGKVEWQPVSGKAAPEGKDALNTASFNVIGRFEGSSPRQIIVGAHVDSSTPEIAGADDDGSGVAVLLEAARVLAAKPHEATLVFVAFCGEEAGLVGSKYFVEHYPLAHAALMLQLDMTSGEAPLMLWIDSRKQQSPAWLVSASLEIYRGLGYRDLEYPTIFQSLNGSLGGAGSDHEPFLAKGIPAIAFVSDIRHPIHTPCDTLEYFKPEGLVRSGRLVVGLIDKFHRGQPAEKAGRYMLVLAGGRPFFINPSWLAAFVVLSLAAALSALIRLYRRRGLGYGPDEDKKVKKSWPKLIGVHLVMLCVTFSSFWIMGRLRGVRLPWVSRPGAYVLYAFLFFMLGVWLSLQILRKWRLRRNAFFYAIRAGVYLAVLIMLFGFAAGPRLAFYPAAGLFLISLACLARPAWLKGALWLMSPVPDVPAPRPARVLRISIPDDRVVGARCGEDSPCFRRRQPRGHPLHDVLVAAFSPRVRGSLPELRNGPFRAAGPPPTVDPRPPRHPYGRWGLLAGAAAGLRTSLGAGGPGRPEAGCHKKQDDGRAFERRLSPRRPDRDRRPGGGHQG